MGVHETAIEPASGDTEERQCVCPESTVSQNWFIPLVCVKQQSSPSTPWEAKRSIHEEKKTNTTAMLVTNATQPTITVMHGGLESAAVPWAMRNTTQLGEKTTSGKVKYQLCLFHGHFKSKLFNLM